MRKPRAETVFAAAVLAAGLVLRLLYLVSFAKLPVFDFPAGPDVSEYWRLSTAFLVGSSVPPEELIHAPLYPVFLAGLRFLSGGSVFVVRTVQSAAVLLAGLLFYGVLCGSFRRGGEDRESGILRYVPEGFLLFYALYPPVLMWQCDFFSENLLIVFLGFAIYLLDHALRQTGRRAMLLFAAGGAASALAALTHPISLFFAAGVFLYLILFRRTARLSNRQRIQHALLFGLAMTAVLAPFSVSRSLRAGKFVLIQQNSALNLYIGNHADATGACCIPPGDEWNRLHIEAASDPSGPDAYFLKQVFSFVRDTPLSFSALLLKKAGISFTASELTTWSDLTCLELTAWHRLGFHVFPFLAIPALAALFLGLGNAEFRRKLLWPLILFFSFWAAQILLVTSGRYRIPMILAMMAFAPWFLLELSNRIRRDPRHAPIAFVPLLPAAILVFFPHQAAMPDREREAADMILAESLNAGGETDKAREILRTLYEKGNRSCALLNRLGAMELDSGHPAEAMRYLGEALAGSSPDHPAQGNTLLNLGRAAELQGDLVRAEACYRNAAVRLTGQGAAAAYFNLGTLRQQAGDAADALACYRRARELDPLNPAPLRNLSILALEKNDLVQAESYLKEACRLEPADPQRKLDLAYVLHLAGREPEARDLLNAVLMKDPENERAQELRSLLAP